MEKGVEEGNERSDEIIESAWTELGLGLGFWAGLVGGGSVRLIIGRVLFSTDFCLGRLQQDDKLIV